MFKIKKLTLSKLSAWPVTVCLAGMYLTLMFILGLGFVMCSLGQDPRKLRTVSLTMSSVSDIKLTLPLTARTVNKVARFDF